MANRNLDPYIDATHVVGTLWQGAYPAGVPNLHELVDIVVLCAEELQEADSTIRGVEVWHVPLTDRAWPLTPREKELAHTAALLVRRALDKGRRVLVTCRAGLNRSGLVSALSLMYPATTGVREALSNRTPSCLTSIQAIHLVRKARGPFSLGNNFFVEHLLRSEHVCMLHQNAAALRLVS